MAYCCFYIRRRLALLQADSVVDELMAFLEKHRLLLNEEAKKNLIVIRENEELQKLLDEQEKKLAKIHERKKV